MVSSSESLKARWAGGYADYRIGAKDGFFDDNVLFGSNHASRGIGLAISAEEFLKNMRNSWLHECSIQLYPTVDSSGFMREMTQRLPFTNISRLTIRDLPMAGEKANDTAMLFLSSRIWEIELSPLEEPISPSQVRLLRELFLWNPSIGKISVSQLDAHLNPLRKWSLYQIPEFKPDGTRLEIDPRTPIRNSMNLQERCLEVMLQSLRPHDANLEPKKRAAFEALKDFLTNTGDQFKIGSCREPYDRSGLMNIIYSAAKIRKLEERDGYLVEASPADPSAPSSSSEQLIAEPYENSSLAYRYLERVICGTSSPQPAGEVRDTGVLGKMSNIFFDLFIK